VKGKKSKSHGKIGFAEMARTIAALWKKIISEEKIEFDYLAEIDRERYEKERDIWRAIQLQQVPRESPAKLSTFRGFASVSVMMVQGEAQQTTTFQRP
jgi:hypothetical protein